MARVRRGADRAATCSTIRTTAARPVSCPAPDCPDADLDVIGAERGKLRLDPRDGLVEFRLGHAAPALPPCLAWISLTAASTAAGSSPIPIARSRIPASLDSTSEIPTSRPVWSRPTETYADAIRKPRPSSSATGITPGVGLVPRRKKVSLGLSPRVKGVPRLGRPSGGLAGHRRVRRDPGQVRGGRDWEAARGLELGADVALVAGRLCGPKGLLLGGGLVVLGFGVGQGYPGGDRAL